MDLCKCCWVTGLEKEIAQPSIPTGRQFYPDLKEIDEDWNRRQYEDGGRNWPNVTTPQGMLGTSKYWNRPRGPSLEPAQGAKPCWHPVPISTHWNYCWLQAPKLGQTACVLFYGAKYVFLQSQECNTFMLTCFWISYYIYFLLLW